MTRTFDTWYNSEVRRLLDQEAEQILADAEIARDLELEWEREEAEQILADAKIARDLERGHSSPSPSKRRRTDSQPESSASAAARSRSTQPQPPSQPQPQQPQQHQQPSHGAESSAAASARGTPPQPPHQSQQPWMTAVTNILSQPMSTESIPGTTTTNEVHVISWEFQE